MKLSDLPGDTNLQKVKVRLSDSLYNSSSLPDYKIETKEVYIMGAIMGDFFVKLKPEDTQVYPMYRDWIPWEELKDLEVIEDEKVS